MWRNYLTVGLRALAKNRMFSVINILGLALGLAASIVLLLYVRHETSYDAWLMDADRVYQVQSIYTDPETGHVSVQQGTHGAVAEPLAKDFFGIEFAARADEEQAVLLRDGEPQFADLLAADPALFQILELPFLHGDPRTALQGADSLVMSSSEAIKFFGTPEVLGETITQIRRGEKRELRVTGVFKDLPPNSHMVIKNVARISPEDAAACSWGCVNGFVYVKLRPGASADEIMKGLPAWEKRNIPPVDVGGFKVSEGDAFDWRLVNVRNVHLSGAEPSSPDKPTNDRSTIITFTVIALLILGIASANFVNLATARAGQRAREVALRKVLGANRRQLIMQFLAESLLLTGLALLIAVALAELVLPQLSAFLNVDLPLDYLGEGGLLGPVLLLWLIVGLAGGLYPAFYLSRYQPGAVLKANKSSAEPAGTGRLRGLLVVAQFAVSIGLIVCTLVIYAQSRFVRTTDAGYQRDGLIQVQHLTRAQLVPVIDTLVREVKRLPGVRDAAAASISVASGTTLNTSVQVPGRAKPLTIGWYSVSPEFFGTMGTRLLAGRTLSRDQAKDRMSMLPLIEPGPAADAAMRELALRGGNVVVNRLAARQLGFSDPAQAIGKTFAVNQLSDEIGLLPVTIVGVVEDARFRSMREPPEPMIFHDAAIYRTLVVRYDTPNPEAVREAVGAVWRRIAPEVPYDADYAEAELAELYRIDRARGLSFAGFAALAVVIACLGLFGLAAFTAERRTKEIGIRKVFGATVADIVRLLAWQFTRPVVIANLIAWPVAWWLMRDWLNGFDLRIDLGPGPFVVAGLIAFAVALGTVAGHAYRIARANPIHALRYE
jgi:putative ABC transport system permease protein